MLSVVFSQDRAGFRVDWEPGNPSGSVREGVGHALISAGDRGPNRKIHPAPVSTGVTAVFTGNCSFSRAVTVDRGGRRGAAPIGGPAGLVASECPSTGPGRGGQDVGGARGAAAPPGRVDRGYAHTCALRDAHAVVNGEPTRRTTRHGASTNPKRRAGSVPKSLDQQRRSRIPCDIRDDYSLWCWVPTSTGRSVTVAPRRVHHPARVGGSGNLGHRVRRDDTPARSVRRRPVVLGATSRTVG